MSSVFKVGQKVWSVHTGWGKITEIQDDEYPILVESVDADGCRDFSYFTASGRYLIGAPRSLFFKEVIPPEDALIPPIEYVELNAGDIIVFKSGSIAYVEAHSDTLNDKFQYHAKVPKNLDEAFNSLTSYKDLIDKVVGNINAVG